MEVHWSIRYIRLMDEETRAAFGRIDRYFELSQLQFGELRSEFGELRSEFGELRSEFGDLRSEFGDLRSEVAELRAEVRANTEGLQALRSEFRGFRDWTETSFARIRAELK